MAYKAAPMAFFTEGLRQRKSKALGSTKKVKGPRSRRPSHQKKPPLVVCGTGKGNNVTPRSVRIKRTAASQAFCLLPTGGGPRESKVCLKWTLGPRQTLAGTTQRGGRCSACGGLQLVTTPPESRSSLAEGILERPVHA